jgi:hypothetical protein
MTPLLLTLIACLTLAFLGREFFAYLKHKDHVHHDERRELYARIQTPELAPVFAPKVEGADEVVGYSEEDEIRELVAGEPA